MNGELILCISCTLVFLLGLLTRRFGTAGGVVLLLLVANICISSPDSRAPYGSVLSIILFTTLIVLHSKSHGQKSPLYRYNPYNSQSELPKFIRVFLLMLAVVTTFIAILVRIIGRFNEEVDDTTSEEQRGFRLWGMEERENGGARNTSRDSPSRSIQSE